jgi:hypothetical protein
VVVEQGVVREEVLVEVLLSSRCGGGKREREEKKSRPR